MRLPLALNLPTRRWPWPLPALAAWALSWTLWVLACRSGVPPLLALLLAAGTGGLVALSCQGLARRLWVAGGFPLSALALGAADGFPAWGWLLLLLPLLLAYPLRAWRDAPFFPTPAAALAGLDSVVGTQAHVLDVGCGLGHGLRALRRLWPQAQIEGVEWSPLLALLARLACPWAHVRRGDLWAGSWAAYGLVYAFQRPESMARLWAKAQAELPAGSWLVSLEFAVPGVAPHACLQRPGQRPVWVYRTAAASTRSTGARSGR
jgi:SAM-dependent methyltransferase